MRGAKLGNKYHYKHGKEPKRLYNIWKSMRQRCNNPNATSYPRYGARGITVCSDWDDFAIFREWAIHNGYSATLTIDRINNSGNYEPNNCRWVSYETQNNNRRDNRILECNGEKRTMAEWSKITGISENTIYARLRRGWTSEQAILSPVV